jgi:hypothetical protein
MRADDGNRGRRRPGWGRSNGSGGAPWRLVCALGAQAGQRDTGRIRRRQGGGGSNNCPVIIDVGGGWGAAAVGALERNGIPMVAFNGVNPSAATTREGRLRFYNKRAEGWWRFREELDADQEFGSVIALPPDASIKADLAGTTLGAYRAGVKIEDKEAIQKQLGRSPDDGDAIVMCVSEGARAIHRTRFGERTLCGVV